MNRTTIRTPKARWFTRWSHWLLLVALPGLIACGSSPPPAPSTPTATDLPDPTPTPPAVPAPRTDATLIPRDLLFGNPERVSPKLSPDGRMLAYLAPKDGVLNVWVVPADTASDAIAQTAQVVTADSSRGIRTFLWAYTSQHILYMQDQGGDENWRVYAVAVATKKVLDLTPKAGIAARIDGLSAKSPNVALIAMNDRDPHLHDIYRVDITTGATTRVLENNENLAYVLSDDDFVPRLGLVSLPDGGAEYRDLRARKGADGTHPVWLKVPFEDAETTTPMGFDASGKTLYLLDSRGRDTAALFAIDFASNKAKLLLQDARADVQNATSQPRTGKVQAASVNYERASWHVLDKALAPDFAALAKLGDGELDIVSRTLDDRTWLVTLVSSDAPVRFYRYDRKSKLATFLFANRPALEKVTLATMHSRVITSRDGLSLVSYLTLPKGSDPDGDGVPASPVPMVLKVHGGPWSRDAWGLDGNTQWLADRGYAVLSVNFRGSTGFGKRFLNAANLEWAGKMHDDLIDAVDWAVASKVALADKVAIMGASYGGYATLVGLTFTPERFACGVDIVGPSNIETLLGSIPAYWQPQIAFFHTRVGDPTTAAGKQFLAERSPLHKVDRIQRPLLIGQGANDPRVKQAESDQIVAAMQAHKIPVTYVLFPDEGHGFARPENRTAFNAVAETFLAQCLGGAYEPIGDDFKGASITVPAGASQVYALESTLGGR